MTQTSRSHKTEPKILHLNTRMQVELALIPRANEFARLQHPERSKGLARCVGRRRKRQPYPLTAYEKANIFRCRQPSTVVAKRFPRPALSASCAYGGSCRTCRTLQFDALSFFQPSQPKPSFYPLTWMDAPMHP
jgi:hypothetical protein